MFGVGHLALGYFCGFATARLLQIKRFNVPLVMVLSVAPDIDILIPQLTHRGPLHSIVVAAMVFLPVFLLFKKAAAPYLAALVSHSLIGDFVAGGRVQLFWPVTAGFFGVEMSIKSPLNMTLEWLLFAAAFVVIIKAGHITLFLEPHYSNLLLVVPVLTVLLPTLLAFPLDVPVWLVPLHLVFMLLFGVAILLALFNLPKTLRKTKQLGACF